MKNSKAKVPKTDARADLQKLWDALKEQPPGKIVGLRSKVARGGRRKSA